MTSKFASYHFVFNQEKILNDLLSLKFQMQIEEVLEPLGSVIMTATWWHRIAKNGFNYGNENRDNMFIVTHGVLLFVQICSLFGQQSKSKAFVSDEIFISCFSLDRGFHLSSRCSLNFSLLLFAQYNHGMMFALWIVNLEQK